MGLGLHVGITTRFLSMLAGILVGDLRMWKYIPLAIHPWGCAGVILWRTRGVLHFGTFQTKFLSNCWYLVLFVDSNLCKMFGNDKTNY